MRPSTSGPELTRIELVHRIGRQLGELPRQGRISLAQVSHELRPGLCAGPGQWNELGHGPATQRDPQVHIPLNTVEDGSHIGAQLPG